MAVFQPDPRFKSTPSLRKLDHAGAFGKIIRPPHSPTPVRVLTLSGAADAKANSLQLLLKCSDEFEDERRPFACQNRADGHGLKARQ